LSQKDYDALSDDDDDDDDVDVIQIIPNMANLLSVASWLMNSKDSR
jgi:hypothetical protein